MLRQKKVVHVSLEFEDGSIEQWAFPVETQASYRESTNRNTERNPVREEWHEHEIRWVSNRVREVKKK